MYLLEACQQNGGMKPFTNVKIRRREFKYGSRSPGFDTHRWVAGDL